MPRCRRPPCAVVNHEEKNLGRRLAISSCNKFANRSEACSPQKAFPSPLHAGKLKKRLVVPSDTREAAGLSLTPPVNLALSYDLEHQALVIVRVQVLFQSISGDHPFQSSLCHSAPASTRCPLSVCLHYYPPVSRSADGLSDGFK